MSRDVWFKDDIRNAIAAGLGLAIELSDGSTERLEGAIAMARHFARVHGVGFGGIAVEVRASAPGLPAIVAGVLTNGGDHEG